MLPNRIHLSWLLILPLLLLFPADAFSAAPAIFSDPPAGDVSIKLFLSKLFAGALPGTFGAGGQDPLAAMFGIFNGGMLIVAGIIAAYTLVVGTMQTAHDGEMLGKQWSSLWVPIRMVMGIGLVVPLGSGYCVAQYIVMWLTIQSVGLADSLWTVFVNDYLKQSAANVSAPNPNLRELATHALQIQVCMESSDKFLQDNPTNLIFTKMATKVTEISPSVAGIAANKITFGASNTGSYGTEYGLNSFTDSDMCGSITRIADLNNGATAGMLAVGAGAGGALGLVGVSTFMDAPLDVAPIYAAHRTARDAMMAEYKVIAKDIVDQKTPDPAAFDAGIVNYVKAVQAEALNTAGAGKASLDAIANNASQNGWMLAGAWYAKVASITNKINTSVRSVESSMVNNEEILENSKLAAEYAVPNMGIAKSYIDKSEYAKVLGGAIDLGITKQVESDGQTGGLANKLAERLLKSFTNVDIARLANDPRHPLIVVQEMGESIISWISIGVAAMAVISIAPVGALVAPILGALLFAAWGAAVIMAIYTPLLPFVIFLGASVGWMILVIEAMIAAPIWAVMHLSPSGSDFMGNAKPGYTLLLSLLLRPALIIIGFAAAIVISYPIGYLLNAVFFDAFFLSMGESGSFKGFFTTIAAMVVYAGLVLALLHKAFSLIHVVPDQVLRWFGAGDSTIGKNASEMGGEGKVGVAAMGALGHSVGSSAGSIGSQARQLRETRRGAVAQEEANRSGRVSEVQTARESAQEAVEAADVAEATAQQTGLPAHRIAADNARSLASRRIEAAQQIESSASARGTPIPPNRMPYANRETGNTGANRPASAPGSDAANNPQMNLDLGDGNPPGGPGSGDGRLG